MKRSSPTDLEKERSKLLEEIEELEREIEDIKKRIPPHSAKYEIIQLLEEKEEELKRKKLLFKT
jgi:cell division septum initiation protein DivIVA